MKPISVEKSSELNRSFQNAKTPSLEEIKDTDWNCELYGMRSQKQQKQKENFYKFSQVNLKSLKNQGHQIIDQYAFANHGLTGTKGPLIDLVRKTQDGHLISELSIPNRNSEKPRVSSAFGEKRTVVAYALCKK